MVGTIKELLNKVQPKKVRVTLRGKQLFNGNVDMIKNYDYLYDLIGFAYEENNILFIKVY